MSEKNEIDIKTTMGSNWYNVTIKSTTRVQKPWFVSPSAFVQALRDQAVEKFAEKRETILNQIASHL